MLVQTFSIALTVTMKIINKKLALFYGIVFTFVVVFDLAAFLMTEKVVIVNWAIPVHYIWVLSALGLFWLVLILQKRSLSRLLFGIYFLIFALAWVNQYFPFTPVLTSYCMLLNALLASMHFSIRPAASFFPSLQPPKEN